MKRILVLVAAIGLILPAAASAGAFRGVVIAKNAKRQSLVTASADGTVHTVRAPKAFRKTGIGALVAVRAVRLPDMTFAATGVRQLGRAAHARVRGTVVKRSGGTLYLSAGNSVFAFGLRGGAGAKLHPGDRVTAKASIGNARLFCDEVNPAGHAGQLELEGIYLSNDQGVLSLAVHGRGLVRITVPDAFDVPQLKAGDEVSLVATVESDGTFTLVSVDNEDASDNTGGGDGVDMGHNLFTVTGVLSSLSSTGVAVQVEHHPDPVRCAVLPTTDLSGFAAGQLVEMSCKLVDGHFVLVELNPKTTDLPSDGGGSVDMEGLITALSPTVVTVQIADQDAPVQCGLPAGVDLRGFAVGDEVEITCEHKGSGFNLTSISSDSASWSRDDMPTFTLDGVLESMRSDGVGVQVAGHPSLVNCAMPAGTSLAGFALGDTVEMQCNFHDGKFNLASLSSDTAQLTLE